MTRTLSRNGMELIKKWEGLRLKAYKCSGGKWTIGYGHTTGVNKNLTCIQEQADAWLYSDCQTAMDAVNRWDTVYNWSQNEFDALVSFTFNCGSANLKSLLKNGTRTRTEIEKYLPQYCKAGGRVVRGLINRRNDELRLFMQ